MKHHRSYKKELKEFFQYLRLQSEKITNPKKKKHLQKKTISHLHRIKNEQSI